MTLHPDKDARIMALLERGFRTHAIHLKGLEKDLIRLLHRARNIGMMYSSPDDWNPNWCEQWDNVENILLLIGRHVEQTEGNDALKLASALDDWKLIQIEDDRLVTAFQSLRTYAVNMNTGARHDWILIARQMEAHVETIYACARSLRIKLEWSKIYSKEEAAMLSKGVVDQAPFDPKAPSAEAGSYALSVHQALGELENERNQFFGILDDLKTLFMWEETPEERQRAKAALRV